MSTNDLPATPDSAPAAPPIGEPVARRPFSGMAVAAFILAVATAIGWLTIKVLVPVFGGPSFAGQANQIATVFGILGLLSIIPTVLIVLLGHLAVRRTREATRGRVLALVGLTLGYLLVAIYLNRIIVAAIAVVVFKDGGDFVQNNFFWA